MIDFNIIKKEIVERLKPLQPDKIILFGSYAYGTPNKESDIDLFLLREDLDEKSERNYAVKAHLQLKELINKYHLAFDILAAKKSDFEKRKDHFSKIDILQNGITLYAK